MVAVTLFTQYAKMNQCQPNRLACGFKMALDDRTPHSGLFQGSDKLDLHIMFLLQVKDQLRRVIFSKCKTGMSHRNPILTNSLEESTASKRLDDNYMWRCGGDNDDSRYIWYPTNVICLRPEG